MYLKVALTILALIIVLVGFLYWRNSGQVTTLINTNSSILTLDSTPTPSPMPFEDLTVPYLRNREYKSSLGELEFVSKLPTYTSYLTSYDSDGLKVNGLLTQPVGDKPAEGWPAIVFVHGYIAPTVYQTLEKYVEYVDYLARNGYVVFKIDLRGHGDSEGTPGGGYYSSDYVIDTLNAVAALESSGFVNPDKVGLWGHSMAGNVTLRSMAARPEIPALVIWGGVGYTYVDINEYGINDNSYRPPTNNTERQRKRQELRNHYGDAKDGNPFWKLVAPTEYLNDLKGAIQLDHAVNDAAASIEYSRNLDRLLDATSVPHELHEYSGGGHNIEGAYFGQAMRNTVNFYNRYLKGD